MPDKAEDEFVRRSSVPETSIGTLLLKLMYLTFCCLKGKPSLLPQSVATKTVTPSASLLLSAYVVLVQLDAMSV